MIRVLVTGGRDYTNRARVFAVLDSLHMNRGPIGMIIHGACGWDADYPDTWIDKRMLGADALADRWARMHEIQVNRIPARWTVHSRKAGRLRNIVLVEEKPAYVVAFPGGHGTADCVYQARIRNIEVLSVTDMFKTTLNAPSKKMRRDFDD